MSYLGEPRVAFNGRFLSDVSTINNANPGGVVGWNPQGGAAFEFLNCKISGGWLESGNASDDPVLTYAISGLPNSSSGKMVDLDPDWQMASQLWALWVRLFDPASGDLAFIGRYTVASFRDLWMRQIPEQLLLPPRTTVRNGMPMGARFVSTLTGVEWGPAADRSPLLSKLKHQSPGRLSIGLHQFGYFYATDNPRYRTGTLIGAIGPSSERSAETVLIGRRLQPVPLNPNLPCIGVIDLEVAADRSTITMDLGHALPLANVDGNLQDLGNWNALPQLRGCQALAVGVAQRDFAQWKKPTQTVQIFGEASPFSAGWYSGTAGVATLTVATDQKDLTAQPMALYARLENGELIAITQEIVGGLLVRADNFVFRMEPGTKASATFHVSKLGIPARNVVLYLSPQTPLDPPALKFPETVTTDEDGRASITLEASDPGAPRPSPNPGQPAPDGQIYAIAYSPLPPNADGAVRDGTGLSGLDVLAIHVRQKLEIPAAPNWEDDVQPILGGYAVLYPIMSKHLFNLGDYDAVVANRKVLKFAFSRDINDPNYMPVTRDLSDSKRAIIIKWLEAETGDAAAPLRRKPGAVSAAPTVPAAIGRTPAADVPDAKRDNVAAFVAPISSLTAEDAND
jgi:hypothetical protein